MKKALDFRCAVVVAGAFFLMTAHAQDAVIEEIVVTATKRDTTVMDVPASVTAFTGETLETREIEGFMDLNVNVPSLNSGLYNGQVFTTIRGVGFGQTHGTADPAVAQHVDGIHLPRTSSLRGAYHDLGSLEVLRGPQGTLYGRNTTGGSVNLVTRKPTEEFEGRVGVLYGDYDRIQASAMVSGPISDNVLGRVSILYDDRDEAYTKNLLPGFDDIDDEEIKSIRGALRFLPSDSLTIDLSVHYEDWEGGWGFLIYTPPSDALWPIYTGAQWSAEPHEAYVDANADDGREDLIVILNVEWALSDNVTLNSKTGFINSEWSQFSDSDGTDAFVVTYTTGSESDTWSQEFNLNATLLDNRLDLLAGLYYYNDDLDWHNSLPLNFLDHLFGLPPFTTMLRTSFDAETESFAVYVDATHSVTNDWRVYGGIRYTEEEKDAVVGSFIGAPICGFGAPEIPLNEKWDEVSFRVGVQHDLSDQSMVYAQFSQGFRSGGFDSSSCADPFEPEFNDAWEVGFKSTFADGRVTLRSSAFLYDYTDLQLGQLVDFQLTIENAAKAEVKGIEFETQFVVTDRFQIALNYSYLDAAYKDHQDCDSLLFIGNCGAAAIAAGTAVFEDVSGNPLNRAPENSLGIVADYVVPLNGGGELAFTAQWTWIDDIQYRPFDRDIDAQEAYSVGNLFVSYVPDGNSPLTLKGFIKNVADEEYVNMISATATTSFNRLTGPWAPPRTWGIQAVWDF